jgi:hypothetical protein
VYVHTLLSCTGVPARIDEKPRSGTTMSVASTGPGVQEVAVQKTKKNPKAVPVQKTKKNPKAVPVPMVTVVKEGGKENDEVEEEDTILEVVELNSDRAKENGTFKVTWSSKPKDEEVEAEMAGILHDARRRWS